MTRTKPRKRTMGSRKPAHQQELQLSILPSEPKTCERCEVEARIRLHDACLRAMSVRVFDWPCGRASRKDAGA